MSTSLPAIAGVAETCLWIEVEDDSGLYNTCKSHTEGEWQLGEGLELHEFCPYCGKPIEVGDFDDEEDFQ